VGDEERAALETLGIAIAEAVTSMRVPWVAKGGRLAVTITAATLPVRICWRGCSPRAAPAWLGAIAW